ncbi:FAH family protein [Streptomyces sp. NPDC006367]|uniref:FAH family protein n=1 Tax=unclassified Streptomyces TaxID=2593676 RepID=UPI0033B53F4C
MTVLFECSYDHERYVGFGIPQDGEPVRLHPLSGTDLRSLLRESGDDTAALRTTLASRGPALNVPAEDAHRIRTRPPLFPEHPGDALVSGFMMTHHVKAGADVPDQPNWFFKGLGTSLKLPGEPLSVPGDAVAVTEEAEIVLVYVDEEDGTSRYLGHTFGNDLTDIGRFKEHAGHLSYAKLCDAAVAPWLHLGPPPRSVTGSVTVDRHGTPAWKGTFTTGTDALHYDLDTMMRRLFAHHSLHHPGRTHYVYIGADRSSFHAGFRLQDGDRLTLDFASHGVTVSNPLTWKTP